MTKTVDSSEEAGAIGFAQIATVIKRVEAPTTQRVVIDGLGGARSPLEGLLSAF